MADDTLRPVDLRPEPNLAAASLGNEAFPPPPKTQDEARARARDRFKERLQNGEKIGECDCHSESASDAAPRGDRGAGVVGVRFRDSGRTYYFDPRGQRLETGDWVVVETSRGREAGRVIIAPHQVKLDQLQGDLKPVLRRLSDDDVTRMEVLKRESAVAVKTFGSKIRERRLPMKPISAEYSFDGSRLTLNYSSQDRVDPRDLARDLANHFNCRVELKEVGPRDEARLLGGMGRCGRTLCCSSWLPVFPEISMGMAKTQELSLNPTKVSGVCGRLLCCLSYENEQYKQMKAVLPRLGQPIETPQGPGMVVSLQVLKELVTVRLGGTNQEMVFASTDLGFGKREPAPAPMAAASELQQEATAAPVDVPPGPFSPPASVERDEPTDDHGEGPRADGDPNTSRRRRRRRRGGGGRGPHSGGA